MIKKVQPLRYLKDNQDILHLYRGFESRGYTKHDLVIDTTEVHNGEYSVLESTFGGRLYNRHTYRIRTKVIENKYLVIPHTIAAELFGQGYKSGLTYFEYNKILQSSKVSSP